MSLYVPGATWSNLAIVNHLLPARSAEKTKESRALKTPVPVAESGDFREAATFVQSLSIAGRKEQVGTDSVKRRPDVCHE